MFTHVVFFRLKDKSPEVAQEAMSWLMDLKPVIPEIVDLEMGMDVVRSQRSYDFCIIVKFEDREAMDRYQVHPAHQEVLKKLAGLVSESAAVDFESPLR